MKRNFLFSVVVLPFVAVLILSFTKNKKAGTVNSFSDTAILPLFPKAKDYRGANVMNNDGLITFTSGLDNDYYLLDSLNRIGYLYIETKTARFSREAARRIPLNLSVVIDRSGSMAGEKMDFAKKAAKGIIDKLTSDDFVGIVIYDEYIDVLQPAVRVVYKDSIKTKIGKIKPRGSTNLWGGSEKGYAQVKANFKAGYVNRVLLISDGRANAGTTRPEWIREKVQEFKDLEGISISTFGVGLDYNEILMTDMAETGAGNYYYIDKAEMMEAMFEKELKGLLNVAAQNAELRIALPKGITVEKVYPFKYGLQKNEVVIKFRDLFSEEAKALVLQFRINEGWSKEIKFEAKLTYTAVAGSQPKLISNENLLLPARNKDLYFTHFNKAVAEQVVLFAANESMEKAMLEADKGNYDKARRLIENNLATIRRNGFDTLSSFDLRKMDSLSLDYGGNLSRARTMSADSVQRLQKSSRADNYKIRNRKN